MGVGLAYFLGIEGWGSETVLLEKGELTSGSTWHAAGQCPNMIGSMSLGKIHHESIKLYAQLEELTGHPVSWHPCGGIRLALSDREVDWFHHVHGMSKLIGYDAEIIGPEKIKKHHPFLETFGVKAGYLTFSDGHVAPADSTMAMAAGARQRGVEIHRHCQVNDIRQRANGEWEVFTDNGNIVCEHIVNAAGSYCDVVASWSGLIAPISNMLHHYLITEPLQELIDLEKELPVVRDPYSHCYLREETDGILIGPYETKGAHPCFEEGVPWDFESELVAPEVDRLMPWLERATERFPLFGKAGLKDVISGAITHTPDGNILAGPAGGATNYWMCCGSAIGIAQGGGTGKYLAQWMVHGDSEINMAEFDPRRFDRWADARYTKIKAVEEYQAMYTCLAPGQQHPLGRPLRTSSLYDKLKSHGAQFQEVYGWERPRWFDKTDKGEEFSFRRSSAFQAVAAECQAVRERVGLMDLSTFSKYDVKGKDAETLLNRLCANKMPTRTGGVALAHFLTRNGRIDGEVTVTRLADDHFFVLSGATAQIHDFDTMQHGILTGEDVIITDITNDFGTLVLTGPLSRKVLEKITNEDIINENFRWLTGRQMVVAGIELRALRVSYVGELGWELHTPMADMPKVFDALMAAGKEYNITLFGTYAMNSLRMEKAFRGMGSELTAEVNMVEADMERFVGWDKQDYIGKAPTDIARQSSPDMKLVYLSVDADDADCLGNEPVYVGNKIVGITTSGGYGHHLKQSLAFAYVENKQSQPGTELTIEILGNLRKAIVEEAPLWDPQAKRMRG
jgi:dimethylglycine dehydrogenase